jgi:hypothetical protein
MTNPMPQEPCKYHPEGHPEKVPCRDAGSASTYNAIQLVNSGDPASAQVHALLSIRFELLVISDFMERMLNQD